MVFKLEETLDSFIRQIEVEQIIYEEIDSGNLYGPDLEFFYISFTGFDLPPTWLIKAFKEFFERYPKELGLIEGNTIINRYSRKLSFEEDGLYEKLKKFHPISDDYPVHVENWLFQIGLPLQETVGNGIGWGNRLDSTKYVRFTRNYGKKGGWFIQ